MSIYTAKENYDVFESFKERSIRALRQAKEGDTRALDYDSLPSNPDHETVVNIARQLATLPRKPHLLEIGCGFGIWAALLKDKYETYTGVDIIQERIDYAIDKHGSDRARFAVVEKAEWDLEQQFDAVMTVTVIQHLTVPDAICVLKNIDRHLAPDGIGVLYEGRLGWFSEEEAEAMYAKEECAAHMIYKPIALLEREVPGLKWTQFIPHLPIYTLARPK